MSIKQIIDAESLQELSAGLVALMREKKFSELSKSDVLDGILDRIDEFYDAGESASAAISACGWLSAVVRGRSREIKDRSRRFFDEEPSAFADLSADDREYFVSMLSGVEESWVKSFCIKQIVNERSENVRSKFAQVALDGVGDAGELIKLIILELKGFTSEVNGESRLKKGARIFDAISNAIGSNVDSVRDGIGRAIEDFVSYHIADRIKDKSESVTQFIEAIFGVIEKIIAARFSLALYSDTYLALGSAKGKMSSSVWQDIVAASTIVSRLASISIEAVLVIARQGKTDAEFKKISGHLFASSQLRDKALKARLSTANDLDPSVRSWWVGEATFCGEMREQPVDVSFDRQVGDLIIRVAATADAMEKLGAEAITTIEVVDPVLAPVIRKAADGYRQISQSARGLARSRGLFLTNTVGTDMEFNPAEHEMLGELKSGIRRVRVVRNGVVKEFGGVKKTIVKSLVEPLEKGRGG